MTAIAGYLQELLRAIRDGWNRFWFTPTDPATLGAIRILAGAMLFYTHLVWTIDLQEFFGPEGWLTPESLATAGFSSFSWSHFYWINSPAALWAVHLVALVTFALVTLGLFSRPASVLAFLFTISYANRASLAQFGLDAINCMLAMYLMVGPCGAAYSLDRLIARRRNALPANGDVVEPSIGANIAIRLIQVHMCVIYFFSGVGKLAGTSWWDGTAIWGAVGNYEYQSLDMTWLAAYPLVINFLTQFTVAWEVLYPALVWPRITRPLMLALAIPLHMGIALFLGMMTFGLVMLIGNVAFVSPALVRAIVGWRRTTATAAAEPLKRNGGAARGAPARGR